MAKASYLRPILVLNPVLCLVPLSPPSQRSRQLKKPGAARFRQRAPQPRGGGDAWRRGETRGGREPARRRAEHAQCAAGGGACPGAAPARPCPTLPGPARPCPGEKVPKPLRAKLGESASPESEAPEDNPFRCRACAAYRWGIYSSDAAFLCNPSIGAQGGSNGAVPKPLASVYGEFEES